MGTGSAGSTGRLLGSGRTADVYEYEGELASGGDGAWVLRRYRGEYGDAAAEAEVMEHVRGHGYPVPCVRAVTRSDLVMERLSGPTMLEAFAAGLLGPREAGALLARLLRDLHAVPARVGQDPEVRVLHLDLHPENVILTSDGPKVIDWNTAEEGPPGLDWGMSAVIVAQVAVGGLTGFESRAAMARSVLTALLTDEQAPSAMTEEGLVQARRRRAANPTMSPAEVEALGAAEELIRTLLV
ncbi:phosphotransferase [Streptomyces sp. NPDC005485]|uniref:phosphotransferase n=1 Tax=Streptomyces sp. NPDC005485 TaxID=3155591 RepID=UPI0033A46C66